MKELPITIFPQCQKKFGKSKGNEIEKVCLVQRIKQWYVKNITRKTI